MEYLTVREACERLPGKPHPRTVLRRIRKGLIEATHDGSRYFVTQAALTKFLREQTRKRDIVPEFDMPEITPEEFILRRDTHRHEKW